MAFTNSQGRTQTSLADINVTPFVDVVLVLLIIFLVTAPIIESGIEIDVPQTREVKEIVKEGVTVTIDRRERLYVGADAVNINDLGKALRAIVRDPQRQDVYLRSDKAVTWGTVAQVVDRLRNEGFEKVNVVTKPYETPRTR
jgi:biopolymer transport protein ExbD/biopolymer transport protein TolR